MVHIDELAEAALAGEALRLRSLTQDLLDQHDQLSDCAPPTSTDATIRAIAAGLVELFAMRRGQVGPQWALEIPATASPVFLVKAARTMTRLRKLCEEQSPEPLLRRNLFAPPTYLESA